MPSEIVGCEKYHLQVILKSVASKAGRAFTYNYDMTDPWAHIVEVVKITDAGEHTVTKLIDGARAGIPEVKPLICPFLAVSSFFGNLPQAAALKTSQPHLQFCTPCCILHLPRGEEQLEELSQGMQMVSPSGGVLLSFIKQPAFAKRLSRQLVSLSSYCWPLSRVQNCKPETLGLAHEGCFFARIVAVRQVTRSF